VETEVLADGSVRVRVTVDESLADRELVADVALCYTAAGSGLALHHGVAVRDDTLSGYEGVYYLPDGTNQVFLPITVKNGVGEVILEPKPAGKTALTEVSAQVERLFDQAALQYAFYSS
jgi:hypothetical protein